MELLIYKTVDFLFPSKFATTVPIIKTGMTVVKAPNASTIKVH